jgi:hypothetical protein
MSEFDRDDIPEPQPSEPLPVADPIVTGLAMDIGRHVVRFLGWVDLPDAAGLPRERRIVTRFSMPIDVALEFRAEVIDWGVRRAGAPPETRRHSEAGGEDEPASPMIMKEEGE